MRAIIKCKCNVEPNALDGLLTEKGWWPVLSQEHEEIIKRRDELLGHVADDDLVMVKDTLQFTIYDDITKSWGIVSNPTRHFIDFRIRNRDSERLKFACERLVTDLQDISQRARNKKEEGANFTFVGKIEVFEPNSSDHAYFGEVLTRNRFTYARHKRAVEFWVGISALIVGVVLLILNLPFISNFIFANTASEWATYFKGLIDRFGSSAMVTATVSLLNVFLYWADLRRKSVVIWNV